MKKNVILSFLFMFLCSVAVAQKQPEFYVLGFEEKPFDTAARDERYKIVDGNGDLFSIIKLVSNNAGDDLRAYSFDFGLCESRVKEVDGEVWVYVQRNAMRVTITRAGYKTVRYELNTTVQPGKVYEMVLSAEVQKVQKQMVYFKVSPKDSKATVMYKSDTPGAVEEVLGVVDNNGELAENLPLGTYTYRVISKNYHTSDGLLILDNIDETREENVVLRPKFATITLNAEPGVEIRIDGESKGYGTWTGPLNAGTYNIECSKASYKPSTEVLKVEEGKDETVTLKALTPILGTLTVRSSPLGANITIDGKAYGTTPRNINRLLVGNHTVVISKEGYESETRSVFIEENNPLELEANLKKIPDKGMLKVKSTPSGAIIYIDGVDYGVTPKTIDGLLVGNHSVVIAKSGYESQAFSIMVNAAEEANLNVQLKEIKKTGSLSVTSSPSGARIKVGGKKAGKTPCKIKGLEPDTYVVVQAIKDGYSNEAESVIVGRGETCVNFTLSKLASSSNSSKKTKSTSNNSKWKEYFNIGVTGSLGCFKDSYFGENCWSFNGDCGLLYRMGSPTINWLNFIVGVKYEYSYIDADGCSCVKFPIILNWSILNTINLPRRRSMSFYIGAGYEPGFDVLHGGYCFNMYEAVGLVTRHHDFSIFFKGIVNSDNVALSIGCAYAYYF